MARKDTIQYKTLYPSRRSRIRVPQNEFKPLVIESQGRETNRPQDAWWWILHRRGMYRPNAGDDPLEARAVPADKIKGTLPERIVYRLLCEAHFIPDVDFDFQSSLLGGRLELGGIVADFLMPKEQMVIQVQGPTHEAHLRHAKDEEQTSILASMGYSVHNIDDDIILDPVRFDYVMRMLFNMRGHGGRSGTQFASKSSVDGDELQYERIEELLDNAIELWEENYV